VGRYIERLRIPVIQVLLQGRKNVDPRLVWLILRVKAYCEFYCLILAL